MVWTTVQDETQAYMEPITCPPPHQHTAAYLGTNLDHNCALSIESQPLPVRQSGIICTIGPSSRDVDTLLRMMENGMNIARLNFSHGTHEYHAETIENLRQANDMYNRKLGMTFPLGIALDTKGPEIRTGLLENEQIELNAGESIKLTSDKAYAEKGNNHMLYVDYDCLYRLAHVGNRIYLDDGLISLLCTNIQGAIVTCTIENGGVLRNRKSVNIPGSIPDLPAITDKDIDDIKFAVEHDLDMIFASFVRESSTISEIRTILGIEGSAIRVVAKVETQQAMQNIDEIIKLADGIMVARGDLGVDIPLEKVFLAQKIIIAKCNRVGKPVICATHLLDSMITKPRPTRAESCDVANAIFDGADCLLLSGETAQGNYVIESITTLARICKEAEAALWQRQIFIELTDKIIPPLEATHALAISAVQASIKCSAVAIIMVTTSGRSAYLLAKYRPRCPIIAVTRNGKVARQAHLYKAVVPLLYEDEREEDWAMDVQFRIDFGVNFGKARGFIRNGDPVVTLTGSKQGTGIIDIMRIVYVMKDTVVCPCEPVEDEIVSKN